LFDKILKVFYPSYMKDKISNTNRDAVNGANKRKENCNLISDGHEKSIPDQSYTKIVDRHEMIREIIVNSFR
jgi:hypothetical protein